MPSRAEADWQVIEVPGAWEEQLGDYDGFAWYRCFVEVPASWEGSRLLLTVSRIEDVDQAYVNGTRVGANGGMPPLFANPSSDVRQPAVIDPRQVRFGEMNLIAFRVYNETGPGGIIEGPIQLGRLEDAIDLGGSWDFIKGDQANYAQWPNQTPDSVASRALLKDYARRHPLHPAGHRGIVAADREGRQHDLELVRQRFQDNTNVHSNVEGKGDPLPPGKARDALVLGEDFIIDTVLHEPEITQPLYVEFDSHGRLWVTQYIQYPTPAGLNVLTWDNHLRTVFDAVPPPPPYEKAEHKKFIGRDKITIHEDTDGDGRYDSHKIFAQGLNIVTSTCQGTGGVWVLNPPYLLFYPDADGDDIPDGPPVEHLSGFGLEDTHSVANSLKWGPDGWLYACTGSTVTGRVRVASKPEQPPVTFFGQTIWRYHPKTHDFELFAEGGWNNFGVDFDAQGRLYSGTNGRMQAVYFVQGGFYQKSFGKHGPHTNPYAFEYFHGIPIEGDNRRLVQQWVPYTGGAFPGHETHFFGVNCLANRVAVIALEPEGSTFRSREVSPAIESDDVWFRPVHATLGPDGGLYVSDFYDARITHVDPRDNWDRDHGRVYRLRHRQGKPHPPLDLAALSTVELLDLLDHPNQWQRWTARRLLGERDDPSAIEPLRRRLHEDGQGALEALWALHLLGHLDESVALPSLDHSNVHVRLWTVRLLGDRRAPLSPPVLDAVLALAQGTDPEVISQLAASLQRLPVGQALPILERILLTERFSSDSYIPAQLWWALEKQVSRDPAAVLTWLREKPALWRTPIMETKLAALLARRLAADPSTANLERAADLLSMAPAPSTGILIRGMQAGLQGITLSSVPEKLDQALGNLASHSQINIDLLTFGLRLNSASAWDAAVALARDPEKITPDERLALIASLAESERPELNDLFLDLARHDTDPAIQRAALNGLRRAADPGIAKHLVDLVQVNSIDDRVRQSALNVLAGRRTWASALLDAVSAKAIPREALTLDQLLMIQGHGDDALNAQVQSLWGTLRQPDAVKSERLRKTMELVQEMPGDARAGEPVFTQLCSACHQLFDRGGDLGPDLTGYERSNLEFLVTAVVDPNLGVREEFELTTITLRPRPGAPDAAVVSGFVKELTDTQVTLQDLTGQQSVLARRDILEQENSPISIMPEGLLDDLTEAQVRDLFAYLQAPEDPIP